MTRAGGGAGGRAGEWVLRVPLTLLLFASAAFASGTTAWEMNSYSDFIRGQFQGVSLSRDGRMTLAPRMDTLFSSDQPIVWSVAQGGERYSVRRHGPPRARLPGGPIRQELPALDR